MTDILASLFVDGLAIPGSLRFLFMLPLCLLIAIVYKTLRCKALRDITMSSLVLWVTIVVGMYAVGVGLWAVFTLMA